MATYAITIGGSSRAVLLEGFTLSDVTNDVPTLTCEVKSVDGLYRPAVNSEVVVTEDGTRIFGGLVELVEESGLNFAGDKDGLRFRVQAKGYAQYAARRVLSLTLAAGTLKSQITTWLASYTAFGTTLHASQANGPTMPDLVFTERRGDDILNDLAAISGWVWRIDHSNVLRMVAPGDLTAAFDVTDGSGTAVNDVSIETTRNDLYANRIILTVNGAGPATVTETFIAGGGSTESYTTAYPASLSIQDIWPNVLIVNGTRVEPIAFGPDHLPVDPWEWDAVTHTLTHDGTGFIPTAGDEIALTYAVRYPFSVQADDAAGQAAYGLWERRIARDEALSIEAAQALADGMLNAYSPELRTVHYETTQTGVSPGQTQTITLAKRNLSGTALVQEVTTRWANASQAIRAVSAVMSGVYQGTFRGVLDQWMRAGSGGGSSSVTTTGTSGGEGFDYAQHVVVAKSGGDFDTIQAAIDSIVGASSSVRYLVQVMPGKYDEQVTMKSWVDVRGVSKHDVQIEYGSTGGAVVMADYCQLEDVLIENSSTEGHWGIVGTNVSHWHIRNVDLLAPFGSSKRGAGIKMTGSSWGTGFIEHVVINSYTQTNQGIYLESDGVDLADVTLNDVFVDTFEATTGGGVLLNNLIDTQIRDIFARTSSSGYDLRITGTSEVTLLSYFLEFGTSSVEIGPGATLFVAGRSGWADSVEQGGTLRNLGPVFLLSAPSDSGFSWVNQGSSSVSTSGARLALVGAATGTGFNLVARVKTAPSTPYTFDWYLEPCLLAKRWNAYGILFRESSSGKMAILAIGIDSANNTDSSIRTMSVRSLKATDATTFSADYLQYPVSSPPKWLRQTDNGTNRIFSISGDGVNWVEIHSVGRTDFLTANQVGFCVTTENAVTPNVGVNVTVLSMLQS